MDVLPGIMLMYNEMEQENHGYTASQIIWCKNMNLPTDLIHTPGNVGKSNPSGYAKKPGKIIEKNLEASGTLWQIPLKKGTSQ